MVEHEQNGSVPTFPFIEQHQVTRASFRLNDKAYQYSVMAEDTPGTPPDFVGYLHQGEYNNLFVSEHVPEDYRQYMLAHEVMHDDDSRFAEKAKAETCPKVSREELRLARKGLGRKRTRAYAQFRKAQLGEISDWYADPQHPERMNADPEKTTDLVEGMKASIGVFDKAQKSIFSLPRLPKLLRRAK